MSVTMLPPDQPEGSWYGRLSCPQILDALSTLPVFFGRSPHIARHRVWRRRQADYHFHSDQGRWDQNRSRSSPKILGETADARFPQLPGSSSGCGCKAGRRQGAARVYQFHNVAIDRPKSDERVPLQVRLNIEKNGEFASETAKALRQGIDRDVSTARPDKPAANVSITPELEPHDLSRRALWHSERRQLRRDRSRADARPVAGRE